MFDWNTIAFAVLLALLKDRKNAPKYFAALAKVYYTIHIMAQQDARLQAEIEHQEAKGGGR